jgi:hypothetical protein
MESEEEMPALES